MENKKNKKKRQRSKNWLEEDKNLLMDLVMERVVAIENKNTDTNTNSKKLAAWTDLLTCFNGMSKGGMRTIPQLKSQWSIIKMTEKKVKSEERKKLLQTGGGPPSPTNSENSDSVIDINEFDSDDKNQINVGVPLEMNYINVDEISKKGTKSPVMDVFQEPLQEIQNTPKVLAAESIATVEIACRKQLHEIQMANEKRKARNLDLKESLLKLKMEFFRKKIQSLENCNGKK